MKMIDNVVSPKGGVQVQTKDFARGSCQWVSKAMEKALGLKIAERTSGNYF